MKIGIMGGTFDPIHNGHLMLGEYAYREFQLDEIWFMPNGKPPHKNHDSIESEVTQRIDMVREAISEVPYFKLSLYEVKQNKVCYSYRTMQELRGMYPDDEFFFIIGADSLFTLESWRHPRELLKACTILAAFRNDKGSVEMQQQIDYLREKYDAKIELLITPVFHVSSHEIRAFIRQKKSINGLVPDKVEAYITAQHLFEDGHNESTD